MLVKTDWRDEPARDRLYRNLYRKLTERTDTQDDCISWLLTEMRVLQKRVNELEAWRANPYSQMARPPLSDDR
jgi:hypothetical protein